MIQLLNLARRCIYNRWFYGSLAAVCLLNVLAEALDIAHPGGNLAVDVVSLLASGVAALLTMIVFVDLQFRLKR